MKSVSHKIRIIKWGTVVAAVIYIFVLANVYQGIVSGTGLKILVLMGGLIGFVLIGVWRHVLVSRISCPHCGKPVLTRTKGLDQSLALEQAYESCYFCHEKIN